MKADGAGRSPDELEELLAAERTIAPLPPDVRHRAMARARAALVAPGTAVPSRSARRGARLAVAAGVTLFLTAAGAAALQGRWTFIAQTAPVATPAVPPDMPASRVRRPGRLLSQAAAAPAAERPAPPAPAVRKGRTTVSRDREIARYDLELALLSRARTSVLAGHFDQALGQIAQHARQFPLGAFAEEREALRIRSLAGLGRHDEAQAAATAFRARFPRSALLSEMRDRSR